MKSSERSPARRAPAQRQAAAHAGADGNATSPRQQAQGEQIAQLKQHHDPRDKKYLSKDIGRKQVDESARALAIKKSSPVRMSNKEARRQARQR